MTETLHQNMFSLHVLNSNPTYSYFFDSILLHPPLISLFGLPGSLWFPRQCWSVHLSTCQRSSQNLRISLLYCFNFSNSQICSTARLSMTAAKWSVVTLHKESKCYLSEFLVCSISLCKLSMAPFCLLLKSEMSDCTELSRSSLSAMAAMLEAVLLNSCLLDHGHCRVNHVVGCHAKYLPVVL